METGQGEVRVVMEIHGPSHFYINVPHELHLSKARRWMVEASGFPVAVVVVAEWAQLEGDSKR